MRDLPEKGVEIKHDNNTARHDLVYLLATTIITKLQVVQTSVATTSSSCLQDLADAVPADFPRQH